MPAVEILRTGNMITVNPTTPRIRHLLVPRLTVVEKVFLRGKERYEAKELGLSPVFDREWLGFVEDHKGRLTTSFGFLERIQAALAEGGFTSYVTDLQPHPRPEVYAPRWDKVLGDPDLSLRHKQEDFLRMLVEHENGRVDCPPGWGKSYCIGLAARLFPKARIDVVTRRAPVLRDRIYPELCQMTASVGIVGGGKRVTGRRVMCYTVGSLHHADGKADIVFIDEVHECAAADAAYKLSIYDQARLYGLSASHDMRLDNKDIECEAMCGPIRLRVSYQEAESHGMVVPIVVLWSDVISDFDPCAGYADEEKKRYGVWRYGKRNRIIARDARLYGDDVQVLITTEVMEHALALKKRLPEFTLMFDGGSIKERQWARFRKEGILPDDFRPMTPERRARITDRFERGKLKKVICTTVWNVGVSMNHLQVLIRADGGGSPINDVQIPGRTSRVNEVGKFVGIVHDYKDQYNSGRARMALGRLGSYRRMGWQNRSHHVVTHSALRDLMHWGDPS